MVKDFEKSIELKNAAILNKILSNANSGLALYEETYLFAIF